MTSLAVSGPLSVTGAFQLSGMLTSSSSCFFNKINTYNLIVNGDIIQQTDGRFSSESNGFISNGFTRLNYELILIGEATFSDDVTFSKSIAPKNNATIDNINFVGPRSMTTKEYTDFAYAHLKDVNVFTAKNIYILL